MGVDVSAVSMIGVKFASTEEAENFIRENYNTEDDFDIDDFEEITGGLEWQMITAYSDRGGVIGVCLGEEDFDELGGGIKNAWQKVRELFPTDYQDKITAYSWAQYW